MPKNGGQRPAAPSSSAPNMAVTIGSISLPNPVMTAAGTVGYGDELSHHMQLGDLGAVVTKSLAHFAWNGNPAPRVTGTDAGMLNAVGLQGPGVASWLSEDLPRLLKRTPRVIASIWGRSVDDFERAAALMAAAPPQVLAVEVNLSCPNLEGRSGMFAHSVELSAAAIDAAKVCGRPVWAKLSPNTHDLIAVASAVSDAGAEAVTLINTVLGMAIDPDTLRPVLGNGGGGLSGSPIRPIAVRAIFDVREALPDLPIVGVGGISRPEHAIEMFAAGASAIQVGTALFRDPRAATKVARDLAQWCRNRGVQSVFEMTNAAHQRPVAQQLPKDSQ